VGWRQPKSLVDERFAANHERGLTEEYKLASGPLLYFEIGAGVLVARRRGDLDAPPPQERSTLPQLLTSWRRTPRCRFSLLSRVRWLTLKELSVSKPTACNGRDLS
jgi:hypothetical protein